MKEEIDKALNYLNCALNRKDVWNNLWNFVKKIEEVVDSLAQPSKEKEELQKFVFAMQGLNNNIVPEDYTIDKEVGGPLHHFDFRTQPKDCYRYYNYIDNTLIFKGEVYDLKRVGKILRIMKNFKYIA